MLLLFLSLVLIQSTDKRRANLCTNAFQPLNRRRKASHHRPDLLDRRAVFISHEFDYTLRTTSFTHGHWIGGSTTQNANHLRHPLQDVNLIQLPFSEYRRRPLLDYIPFSLFFLGLVKKECSFFLHESILKLARGQVFTFPGSFCFKSCVDEIKDQLLHSCLRVQQFVEFGLHSELLPLVSEENLMFL